MEKVILLFLQKSSYYPNDVHGGHNEPVSSFTCLKFHYPRMKYDQLEYYTIQLNLTLKLNHYILCYINIFGIVVRLLDFWHDTQTKYIIFLSF
jgi:hypothetical protein